MKWGIRRYQNYDGSLTSAGREHYGSGNLANAKPTKAPQDMMNDVIAANGGKGGRERSYYRHRNCAFCSVAYEMRRRGFDVRSQEALEGVTVEAIQKAVKNLKQSDIHDYGVRSTSASAAMGMTEKEFDTMAQDILKDGPNSRGQVTVEWKGIDEYSGAMGGHALNYEVNNGTFYIVDPQVGKTYSGKNAYEYMSRAINVKTYRTDNKQMDTKITEKYYTEENTGRVADDTKYQRRSEALATAAIGFAQLGTLAMPAIPAIPAAIIPTAAGLGVAGGLAVASSAVGKKAEKIHNEKALELEDKWSKEKRIDFYNQRKKGKK